MFDKSVETASQCAYAYLMIQLSNVMVVYYYK